MKTSRATCFALAVAAAALLGACGGQGGNDPLPTPDLFVTARHDNGIVPMRPGQVLEVRLDGNSTIDPPLTWSVAARPPHLRLNGERIVSLSPDADGAGATWIFSFTAVGEGDGRLVFAGGESGRRIGFQVESAEDLVID